MKHWGLVFLIIGAIVGGVMLLRHPPDSDPSPSRVKWYLWLNGISHFRFSDDSPRHLGIDLCGSEGVNLGVIGGICNLTYLTVRNNHDNLDLLLLTRCKHLESIDARESTLLNVDEAAAVLPLNYGVRGLLNCPLAGSSAIEKMKRGIGWNLTIVASQQNVDALIADGNSEYYGLRICKSLFDHLPDESLRRLQAIPWQSINGCRQDVFWRKPVFPSK